MFTELKYTLENQIYLLGDLSDLWIISSYFESNYNCVYQQFHVWLTDFQKLIYFIYAHNHILNNWKDLGKTLGYHFWQLQECHWSL